MIQRSAIVHTALALATLTLPAPALRAACQPNSPARAVPQFENIQTKALGQSLWPLDSSNQIKLRPAKLQPGILRNEVIALPKTRDSTDYQTLSAPGETSGHELFQDLSIPGSKQQGSAKSNWLIAAYNAGIQVWDLAPDYELPVLKRQKDGWQNEWKVFPAFSEEDTYVHAVDSLKDGNIIYIGVSASAGVGFSLWTFDTTSTVNSSLRQVYQDLNVWSFDVSLVKDPNGRIYAFVADTGGAPGNDGGVRAYDVTTAAQYGSTNTVCVDPAGSNPCGVFEGEVGDIPKAQFVSAIVANGETYIAASDGFQLNAPLKLEIWQVTNPKSPEKPPTGSSALRFDGLSTMVSSPELFAYDGKQYLALVDNLGINAVDRKEVMRVYDVSACLNGTACTGIGSPKISEDLAALPARFHFLDVSFSNGSPMIHYGLEGSGTYGSGFERLWDAGQLPTPAAANTLPELTDGGHTYTDPCNGKSVNYFGDYFEGNDHGLAHFTARHAVFTGPYLYRAAVSVLDIHVRGGVTETNDPTIVPRLQGAGSINATTFWLDEAVMLEADVQNCLQGSTDWCWDAVGDNANVDIFPVPANVSGCDPTFGDTHSMSFECGAAGRCADTDVSVASWNMSLGCAATGADPQKVLFNLKDPEIALTSFDTGGTEFPVCSTVNLDATVEGRGAAQWAWTVNGVLIDGCSGSIAAGTDLSAMSFACGWDTSELKFEEIFLDDFETGCGRWSAGCPAGSTLTTQATKQSFVRRGALPIKAEGDFTAELEIKNGSGVVVDSASQLLSFFNAGNPAFDGPLSPPQVNGSGAVLEAPATGATLWTWEVEDPAGGTAPCSFNAAKSCATEETTSDSLAYLWLSAGLYQYKVAISNCISASTPPTAMGSVEVNDLEPAQITRFEVSFDMLQAVGDGTCYRDAIGGTCGIPQAVYCPTGVPIKFDLQVASVGNYTFSIDWARAATDEQPNFEPAIPDSVSGIDYTFSHTFASGTPSPDFPLVEVPFASYPLDHPLLFTSCAGNP